MKNIILKNTLILLVTNLFIRALGLLNRIILTRFLGEQGISLYSLVLPTTMLFLSISCFSLNTSITKVSSNYNSKKVITIGISIAIITSSISSLFLLSILKTLSLNLLKQQNTYYPILCSIPLFYLTSISSVLRGFLTGREKMSITSIANLIEQLSRIIFTILIFTFLKNKSTVMYVNYCIIAMSIGELISILFSSIYIKKLNSNNKTTYQINNKIKKEILSISLPTTFNSLASNITFFLEPVIFTFVLTKLSFSSNEIMLKYSEVTAYALPSITLFAFIPMSLSTAIMPKMSTSTDLEVKNNISKIITFCLIPSLLITTILYHYCNEIQLFLYNTTTGSVLIKKYVWFFIGFYFISPFNTILISRNQSNKVFILSTIVHTIKLIVILILPYFCNDSLIISYIVANTILFVSEYFILYKQFKFKIQTNNIITIILSVIIINGLCVILSLIPIYFIFEILLIVIIYFLLLFNIFRTNNK